MYLMLAYAFVTLTSLMIVGLLWLWWLERSDLATREKTPLPKPSN